MLTRLAHLATHRARWVVVTAVVLFIAAGAIGGGVAEHLISGGFNDPDAESTQAEEILDEQFGTGVPNVVLVVTAQSGDVDDADVASAGQEMTDRLAAEPDLAEVVSYWSAGNAPPLRNDDGTRALVVGRIDAPDDTALVERIEELAPELRQDGSVVSVEVGGAAELFHEINTTIEEDLLTAEMIAIPVTLLLLVLIFGSIVAATLPVLVGAMSVVGTFLILRVLAEFTDVSIFALNLTTTLGLGLAIDYSLFVVSRYREELRAGHEPPVAVTRTVLTAGRTVAFSALTVAASLCALLVFPMAFLRSFAYAGVGVSIMAGLFAVVVLPAILSLLGHRVNALTVLRRSVEPPEFGFWHRAARTVMRRPVPVATVVVALLLVLGSPFLGINLTMPDDRVLSESSTARQVGDVIRDEFSSTETGALAVVAPSLTSDGDSGENDTIAGFAAQLAQLPSVARVDASTGTYCGEGLAEQLDCEPGQEVLAADSSPRYEGFTAGGGTYFSVVPSVEPLSSEGEALVGDLRSSDAPFPVMVTGHAADLVDTNDSLLSRLPLALGIIALVTFVLLFMMFGSVVVPLKAIVLNLLSLSAMFGAMVWIFQDGNLAGPLDITATGGLNAAMPILMFCVAFGLSMDYEVFLLSRIAEERQHGAGDEDAVAIGLQRTGRIVTAAAVLMAMIFTAFAIAARVSFIKLFGVGLMLAVLMDAFLIRGTLVPAFMAMAGRWNWWAPRPLRRIYERWGISEHAELDEPADGTSSDGWRTVNEPVGETEDNPTGPVADDNATNGDRSRAGAGHGSEPPA